MLIDGKYVDDKDLIPKECNFLKKYNNIYLSEEQKNILDKYHIDVNKYFNINELIFDIEEYLNNSYDEFNDLEWVSQTLAEYNYYNNTNK